MAITHVVLFKFKDGASSDTMQEVSDQFMALKDSCLHPTTHKPYIISLIGGINNSPEGMSQGFTHAFVGEFASAEDRDYYVDKDPAHLAYKEFVRTHDVIKVQVMDFVAGTFV